jgi:acetyl-CoA C-acetyltransferase
LRLRFHQEEIVSTDVVVLSAVRTAIGRFGGGLKDVPTVDLAATVLREALARTPVEAGDVGHVVFGNVIHTEARDMYLSRVAAINGGLPVSVPALTLNRLCGSGLQAIITGAQSIYLDHADVVISGGAENMSRAPYWLPTQRFGQRLGDGKVLDVMVGALTDPFDTCHMGITAENVADKYVVSREDQDQAAVDSHQKAALAVAEGRFNGQIVDVAVPGRGGSSTPFNTDEQIRPDATLADMAKLKPAFKKDGTVTAGNASGINDAAAALVLSSREYADRIGVQPLGRLVAYANVGVEPSLMGIGPVPAVHEVLERAELKLDDIDIFEVNEAFAAQALAVQRELGLDPAKVNPNGSGISLGHPIGASGAILAVKALHELARTGGRYALTTMCIGGGQGIAAIFERESA